jgi:hypothetical protein
LSDVRYEEHSGTRTAEIRFLPAEWLTTPKTTEGVLSYISCVYFEALNNQENIASAYKRFVPGKIENFDLNVLQMLEKTMPGLLDVVVKKISTDVKKFQLYNEYSGDIRFMLNPQAVKAELEAAKFDAFAGWFAANRTKSPLGQVTTMPSMEQFLKGIMVSSGTSPVSGGKAQRNSDGVLTAPSLQYKVSRFIENYNRRGTDSSSISHAGDVPLYGTESYG